MNRRQHEENNRNLLQYTTAPSFTSLALLLSADAATQFQASTSAEHPVDGTSNASLEELMKTVTSVMPLQDAGSNAKYTCEILTDLENLIVDTARDNPLRKEIEQTIRITPVQTFIGDQDAHKHFINNSYLYDENGDSLSTFTLDFLNGPQTELKRFMTQDANEPPTKEKPSVSIIEILKPGFCQTKRDTSEVSIFTNLVSPLEMSRCVPFMRVRMIPPAIVVEGSEKPERTPAYFNIIGFLRGDKSAQDLTNLKAPDNSLAVSFVSGNLSVDGGGSMELFTTPQTMMTTKKNGANFANPILDRTRPFMTLTSVKISVQPAAGWYTHKTANIELVLHDRSRLAQIAPFIKPDIFAGKTKSIFEIEYGWSHPDGKKTINGNRFKNPIGAFLDSLRCKENYEVYNATYSFAESGQVNIALQLTMVSHSSILAEIPEITDVKDKVKEVDALIKQLNQSMKTITAGPTNSQDNLKEIFGEVVMSGMGSADAALSMDLTKFGEIKAKLDAVRTKAKDPDTKKFADEITALVTTVNQAQKTASAAAEARLKLLKTCFEYFPVSLTKTNFPAKTATIPTLAALGPVTKDVVSLGLILYLYVAAPLALTNQFNEVQLIFGVHNDRASFMRSLSVARHPIDIASFQTDIAEFAKKKPKMTIGDFVTMLNEKHISNDYSFAYGFGALKPTKDKDGNEVKPGIEAFDKQSKILTNDAKILDGNYKKPNLKITPECVTAKDGGLILRLHVVDTTAVTYQSYVDLLKSVRDVSSNAINAAALDTDHPLMPNAPEYVWVRQSRAKLLDYLRKKGVIKSVATETGGAPAEKGKEGLTVDALSLVDKATPLKRVVAKGLPYIRYGQAGGMITSIGVAGLSDAGLANAALSVAGKRSIYNAANNDQVSGIPMRVTPSELSVEMLGCPLVNHMQSFFVDLDTMTSLDGIYTVSGVEHSFTPGSFNTSVKMINTGDGYSSFRSVAHEVSTSVARWLQTDPDAKQAVESNESKAEVRRGKKSNKRNDQQATTNAITAATAPDPVNDQITKRASVIFTQAKVDASAALDSAVSSWLDAVTAEDDRFDAPFIDTLEQIAQGRRFGGNATSLINTLHKRTGASGLKDFSHWMTSTSYWTYSTRYEAIKIKTSQFPNALDQCYIAYVKSQHDRDLPFPIVSDVQEAFGKAESVRSALQKYLDLKESDFTDQAKKELEATGELGTSEG